MQKHQKNLKLLYYIEAFFSFSGSLIADMITYYAESIGIFRGLIGMISGFIELVSYTSEVIAGYLSDKFQQRKIFLILSVTAWTLMWIPIIQTTNHMLFLGLVLVQAFLGGSIVPVFDALTFSNSNPKNRVHVITNLDFINQLFGFFGTLVAAGLAFYYKDVLLTNIEITRNLFILAACIQFISLAFIVRIKESPVKSNSKNLFREANFINKYFFQKNKRLRTFLLVNLLWAFATGIPLGFMSIYIINEMGASMFFFFMTNAVMVISMLASIKSWEAFAEKFGGKVTLFFSALLTTIAIAGYLFHYEMIIFANIILGIGWAGFNMTASVLFMNYLPKDDTAGFVGMFDLYMGVVFFIAPIIGGILASQYDIRMIIIVSLILRICVVPLFSFIQEEYKEVIT
ncbi:MFS transporter [Candidatus Woesearchaeota archaeon]|nr:MFS transporter [Candidatus Woesearchaeota archaeon]